MYHLCCMGSKLARSSPEKHFTTAWAAGFYCGLHPRTAHQALSSTLLRWVGLELLYKPREEVQPPAEYVRQLEQGGFVEVEGYQWSSRLWRESFGESLPALVDR